MVNPETGSCLPDIIQQTTDDSSRQEVVEAIAALVAATPEIADPAHRFTYLRMDFKEYHDEFLRLKADAEYEAWEYTEQQVSPTVRVELDQIFKDSYLRDLYTRIGSLMTDTSYLPVDGYNERLCSNTELHDLLDCEPDEET